jgi:hypothetical protein
MRIAAIALAMLIPLVSFAADKDLSWSNPDTEKTPAGEVTFHGPFSNETLSVKRSNLPQHSFVEVQFDLLILRAWDGSVPVGSDNRAGRLGPDIVRANLLDGAMLMYTTFSNMPEDGNFQASAKFQNFPSPIPGDKLAPQSGAENKNTLGYDYPWTGPPQAVPMDATYRIHLIVPHDGTTATFQISGQGLQDVIDESWGVTNLQIEPLGAEKSKAPDMNAIERAFNEAINKDATNPIDAMNTLVLGMESTADWIKINLTPQTLDTDTVTQCIHDLAADDTQIPPREHAAQQLRQLSPLTEPFLRDARKSATGEQRTRIDWLLAAITTTPIEDENTRKVILATRVLEIIGTPKAMEIRKSLVSNK